MSQHTLTTVIEGDLLSILLFLEGERIVDQSSSGSGTISTTDTINVNGPLNVAFQARGVPFTTWTITITEGGKELLDESGMIGAGGESVVVKAVPIVEEGLEALTVDFAGAVKAGAKKGAAKKTGAKKSGARKGGAKKGGK